MFLKLSFLPTSCLVFEFNTKLPLMPMLALNDFTAAKKATFTGAQSGYYY